MTKRNDEVLTIEKMRLAFEAAVASEREAMGPTNNDEEKIVGRVQIIEDEAKEVPASGDYVFFGDKVNVNWDPGIAQERLQGLQNQINNQSLLQDVMLQNLAIPADAIIRATSPWPQMNPLQEWMRKTYEKDWRKLADEPVQLQNGLFGTITKIRTRPAGLPEFLIEDTEGGVNWLALWHFELANPPADYRKKAKTDRKELHRDRDTGLAELVDNKIIEKAYLDARGRLFVITHPTYAIDRDSGKELKNMPMGRWVFSIRLSGTLEDVHVLNLDFSYRGNFHFYSCWGNHTSETYKLFQSHNYSAIVDFLVVFKTLFPHDGMSDMGEWGVFRQKITKKDKDIVGVIEEAVHEPTRWIVGKPQRNMKKVLDLFRDDIDFTSHTPILNQIADDVEFVEPNSEEIVTGSIVKIRPNSEYFYQAPNIIGQVSKFVGSDLTVNFKNGYRNYYNRRSLLVHRIYIEERSDLADGDGWGEDEDDD